MEKIDTFLCTGVLYTTE